MTREEIILSRIKRDGLGLEIGAGCAPIAPKKQGFRVHVLDHCDRKALIEKYRSHGINVDNIEEVDFVWDGRSYTELIGRRHVYDWIIGSHVLEHTTDLIGFLNDCDSLLKKEGVLSLVVPDKRYCSTTFGLLAALDGVIDAARNPQKIHSGRNSGGIFSLRGEQRRSYSLGHKRKRGVRVCAFIRTSETGNSRCERAWYYLDVHEWCFTPTSFRLMMRDLCELGFIQLKELAFHPPQGSEFYITLSRQGHLPEGARLELLGQILREQSAA